MKDFKNRKKLLFISRIPPTLGSGGAQAYSNSILQFCHDSGYEVHVLHLEPCLIQGRIPWIHEIIPETPFHQVCPGYFKIGVKLWSPRGIICSFINKLYKLSKFYFFKLQPLSPAQWGGALSSAEHRWVRKVSTIHSWDVVVCNYCWLSDALAFFKNKNTIKTILTHDVWHQHPLRKSSNLFFQQFDSDQELKYLQKADIVISICHLDSQIFSSLDRHLKIVTAPFAVKSHFSRSVSVEGRLLFVGSNYTPNVDGINWFISQVGPLLELKCPGFFQLSVVGAVSAHVKKFEIPNIKIVKLGPIKNLDDKYQSSSIVIVPIRSGTGLKIKLIEAISYGKAIVTTASGARGLENLENQAFVVANTPEEMAAKIIQISFDRIFKRNLELSTQRVATEYFSSNCCYAEMLKSFQEKDR